VPISVPNARPPRQREGTFAPAAPRPWHVDVRPTGAGKKTAGMNETKAEIYFPPIYLAVGVSAHLEAAVGFFPLAEAVSIALIPSHSIAPLTTADSPELREGNLFSGSCLWIRKGDELLLWTCVHQERVCH